ncbi:hypothetical protein NL676_033128 [Syzygium grande]|nr:hypothetical protein NL676_033128 [Syzygium grande]
MQALSSIELFRRDLAERPVLFEEHSGVRKVILNRPSKLNSLTLEMISQMFSKLKIYEDDPTVNVVILKGNGKAFCAGGDVFQNICSMLTGHWSFGASFYKKQLTLDHLIATYQKPLVCLINGVVMGGGAGLSMHARFRVVTEKTVFAMPEAVLGIFPDVGASHFLSKLPGYFGEYLGLTGARVDGETMLACGLATHFVFSKEKELLDNLAENWIIEAVNSMKSASPTSLKISLRSIREGRGQTIEQCLARDYTVYCNVVRRKITNDYYEGSRAIFFDKDKRPKWEPPKL